MEILLLSSGSFRGLQGIDLLLFRLLDLLYMRRHGTIGVLPLLCRIGKVAAEFPGGKLQHPGATLAAFDDREAFSATVRAACLFHEQALGAGFLCLTLHIASPPSIFKDEYITTKQNGCQLVCDSLI
jgi:hypothetical protein